jgi:hypothetical protein
MTNCDILRDKSGVAAAVGVEDPEVEASALSFFLNNDLIFPPPFLGCGSVAASVASVTVLATPSVGVGTSVAVALSLSTSRGTPNTLNAAPHISFNFTFCSSVRLFGRPGNSNGAISFDSLPEEDVYPATTIPPTAQ